MAFFAKTLKSNSCSSDGATGSIGSILDKSHCTFQGFGNFGRSTFLPTLPAISEVEVPALSLTERESRPISFGCIELVHLPVSCGNLPYQLLEEVDSFAQTSSSPLLTPTLRKCLLADQASGTFFTSPAFSAPNTFNGLLSEDADTYFTSPLIDASVTSAGVLSEHGDDAANSLNRGYVKAQRSILNLPSGRILQSTNRNKTKSMIIKPTEGVIGYCLAKPLSRKPNGKPMLVFSPAGFAYQGYQSEKKPRRLLQGDPIGEKKAALISQKIRLNNFKSRKPTSPKGSVVKKPTTFTFTFGSFTSTYDVVPTVVGRTFSNKEEIKPVEVKLEEPLVTQLPTSHFQDNGQEFTKVRAKLPRLPTDKSVDFKFPKNSLISREKTTNGWNFLGKEVRCPPAAKCKTFENEGRHALTQVALLQKAHLYLHSFNPSLGMGFYDSFSSGKTTLHFIPQNSHVVRVLVRSGGNTAYLCSFSRCEIYCSFSRYTPGRLVPKTLLSCFKAPFGFCYLEHAYYCSLVLGKTFKASEFDLGPIPETKDFLARLRKIFGLRSMNIEVAGYRSDTTSFHCSNLINSFWKVTRLPKFIGVEDEGKVAEITALQKHQILEHAFERVVGGKDSILGRSLEKELIDFKEEIAALKFEKEIIKVPFFMTERTQNSLTRFYPQFNLKFTHSTHSDHPAAAASRLLENYTLSKLCARNFSDIGGEPLFHMKRSGCVGVHVCRPIYDAKDAQRAVLRKVQLENAMLHLDPKVAVEAPSKVTVCASVLGECAVQSHSMVMVQVYDAPLSDVCQAMIKKGCVVTYLTLVTPGELLDRRESTYLEDLDCEIYIENGLDRITYKFSSSCYTHRLSTILEYMTTPLVVRDGYLFSIEMYELRFGVNYYKITKSTVCPTICAVKHLRYKRACTEITRVKLPRFSKGDRLILPGHDYLYLDSKFVTRVHDYVVCNCSTVNSKTFEWVWSFIKSSKSRVVISGKVIHRDVHIDIKHLESFAAVMIASGVRTRLASEYLAKNLNFFSGEASFFDSVRFLISEKIREIKIEVKRYLKEFLAWFWGDKFDFDFLNLDQALETISDYAEVSVEIETKGFGVIDEIAESNEIAMICEKAATLKTVAEAVNRPFAANTAKATEKKNNSNIPQGGLLGGSSRRIGSVSGLVKFMKDNFISVAQFCLVVLKCLRGYRIGKKFLKFLDQFLPEFISKCRGGYFECVSFVRLLFNLLTQGVENLKENLRGFLGKFLQLASKFGSHAGLCLETIVKICAHVVAMYKEGINAKKFFKLLEYYYEPWKKSVFGGEVSFYVIEALTSGISTSLVSLILSGVPLSYTCLLKEVLCVFAIEVNISSIQSRFLSEETLAATTLYRRVLSNVLSESLFFSSNSGFFKFVLFSGVIPCVVRRILCLATPPELSLFSGYVSNATGDLFFLAYTRDRIWEYVSSRFEEFIEAACGKLTSALAGSVSKETSKKVSSAAKFCKTEVSKRVKNLKDRIFKRKEEDSEEQTDYETCSESEFAGLRGGNGSGFTNNIFSSLLFLGKLLKEKLFLFAHSFDSALGNLAVRLRSFFSGKGSSSKQSDELNSILYLVVKVYERVILSRKEALRKRRGTLMEPPTIGLDYSGREIVSGSDSDAEDSVCGYLSEIDTDLDVEELAFLPGLRGGGSANFFSLSRLLVKHALKFLYGTVKYTGKYHRTLLNYLYGRGLLSFGKPIFSFYSLCSSPHLILLRFVMMPRTEIVQTIDYLYKLSIERRLSKTSDFIRGLRRIVTYVYDSEIYELFDTFDRCVVFLVKRLFFSLTVTKSSPGYFKPVRVFNRAARVKCENTLAEVLQNQEYLGKDIKNFVKSIGADKAHEASDSDSESSFAFATSSVAGKDPPTEPEFERAVFTEDVRISKQIESSAGTAEWGRRIGHSRSSSSCSSSSGSDVSEKRKRKRSEVVVCKFLKSLNTNGTQPIQSRHVKKGQYSDLTNSVLEFYYMQELALYELHNKLSRYFDQLSHVGFDRKQLECDKDEGLFVIKEQAPTVVYGRNQTCKIKEFKSHEFNFNSRGLVPFDSSDKGNKILHVQSSFVAANRFLASYNDHKNFIFSNSGLDVLLYEAPPGGGKTTTLIDCYLEGMSRANSIVLTANKSSQLEILKKVNKALQKKVQGSKKPCVLTIDSYLMNNRGNRCEILYIDECFMVHAGAILAAIEFTMCKKCVLFGDSRQIHYIERNEYDTAILSDLNNFISPDNRVFGEVSYRCPWDVCALLSTFYPKVIASTNVESAGKSSMSIHEIESVEDVNIDNNYVYLTMLQSEKQEVQKYVSKKGAKCVVMTVHEAQGETYNRVNLVRTKFQEDEPFRSDNHITVALSRHVESLVYSVISSRRDDAISSSIRKAKELVETFRIFPTSFGGSTLDINVAETLPDKSKCKASSAPLLVINDFLNEVVEGSAAVVFGDLSAEMSSQPFESGADNVIVRDTAPLNKGSDHEPYRV